LSVWTGIFSPRGQMEDLYKRCFESDAGAVDRFASYVLSRHF